MTTPFHCVRKQNSHGRSRRHSRQHTSHSQRSFSGKHRWWLFSAVLKTVSFCFMNLFCFADFCCTFRSNQLVLLCTCIMPVFISTWLCQYMIIRRSVTCISISLSNSCCFLSSVIKHVHVPKSLRFLRHLRTCPVTLLYAVMRLMYLYFCCSDILCRCTYMYMYV